VKKIIFLILCFFVSIFFSCKSFAASQLEQLYFASLSVNNNYDEIFMNPNDVVLGNSDGNVTLVEFFDYNCGYCKRALSDMIRLMDSDPDLRVVLKEYPILNESSDDMARLSLASAKQGYYLEYHRELLNIKGPANYNTAVNIAEKLGMDIDKLQVDSNGKSIRDSINSTKLLGFTLGVNGTPGYVIGDVIVSGAIGFDGLLEIIGYIRENGMHSMEKYIMLQASKGDIEAQKIVLKYDIR
jgi:protein-disulfide isomerase